MEQSRPARGLQPHLTQERGRASAENRTPVIGFVARTILTVPGSCQATCPWYRQRLSFGRIGDVHQLTDLHGQARGAPRRKVAGLSEVTDAGLVIAVVAPHGTPRMPADLQTDAGAWAAHFDHDTSIMH